jgi:diguanylate cyclase (GGDEF)-like protein
MPSAFFALTPVNLGQFLSVGILTLSLYSFLLNLAVGFDGRMLVRDTWIFACGLFSFMDYFFLKMALDGEALLLLYRTQLAIIPIVIFLVVMDIARCLGFKKPRRHFFLILAAVFLSSLAFLLPLLRYEGGRLVQTSWYIAYYALNLALSMTPIALAAAWLIGGRKDKAQTSEMLLFLVGFAAIIVCAAVDGSAAGFAIAGERVPITVYAMSSLAVFGLVSNVLRYRRVSGRIKYLAEYDELTDTLKRKMGVEEIERRIRARKGEFSVILFNLDGFKKINDLYGYNAGNLCLTDVALQLKKLLSPGDVFCRTEGDEFLIVADGVHRDVDESPLLGRIAGEFVGAVRVGGRTKLAGYRIGISVFPEHGGTASELLRNADESLELAKRMRGRKLMVYDLKLAEHRLEAYQTEEGLKETLRGEAPESGFILHYQPKVDRSGSVRGVEGLMRWNYRGRLFYPDSFIYVAEKTGLIHEMGGMALARGCRDLKDWLELSGGRFSLSVNLSPQQLNDSSMAADIRGALEDSGIPPETLELELTESTVMDFWNSHDALGFMREMRALGVKVSIDDFGTGQSSFSRLLELPADVLKIDRSFISNLPENGKSRRVCQMIVTLAHDLGMTVVAEGVEQEEQADFLFSIGCDLIQGFYFYKPMPAKELESILQRAAAR